MEDLVRRYCSRRDAQGNAHTLAEDIRMSSLEALLPDDLEKHAQMNRARLNSYSLLRDEIKTYCEYRGHASVRTKQKGPSHPGGDDPMGIGDFGKGKGKQSKGKHGKGKGKGMQGQQGQGRQGRDKSRDSMVCWNCGKRGHPSKDCWSKNDNKGKEKHKKVATDAHNLDSKKPEDSNEPEVEIGGFHMFSLDAADEIRVSEWVKIGVDTGAGKTAWPQNVTCGKTIPGESDVVFRTATGELVKSNKQLYVDGCDDWEPVLEFEVFKHRCANRCCLLVSTRRRVESQYGNKGYMFHKGSTVAKKIDAWIQKEVRDSQHRGCTIAYQENTVYNIVTKPRGIKN